MFDSNIKIHFAGSDGEETFFAALSAAQTKYRLYSCYKYINKKSVDADFTLPANHVIRVQDRTNRHVIQDSGLFTLMFGAGKGQPQTRKTLTMWQDKLMAFVEHNHLSATCVEIDCQKILSVEDAWFFRERMRRMMPHQRQINVFHFEDGQKGLDRLIEFSDYIAIGVPELRIVKPKTFREDTKYLAHYIKNRKPSIDIHLLGCTDFRMIAENCFCTSADSTSWLSGVKFGHFNDGVRSGHINEFRRDLFAARQKEVRAILRQRNVSLNQKTLDYCTNASLCASICKQRYERAVGPQD